MIVLKVKLKQEPSGALYAEVLDGLNSVSQNNRAKNKLRVELDGFDLEDGVEFLQAGYSTSPNEDDVETETVNFAIMSEVKGNAWEQELPPEVVALRGKWYLYLRVATFDGTGDVSSVNNATNEIEFAVNNALPAANNAYPNMGDIASLYAQSKENASAADSSAQASESSANAAASSASEAAAAVEEAKAQVETKQDKFDNSLETDSKTVPGAINELNESRQATAEEIRALFSALPVIIEEG